MSRLAVRTALVTGATGIGAPGTEPMGGALDQMAATLRARRAARAEQIAPVVALLASEEAGFIYGAVVHADGDRLAV